MPNHPALAIANEILRLRDDPTYPAQMKLQKLVYVAHGWNLAINHSPLVSEIPQAWDGGPVFRSIWNHIRDYGYGRLTHLLEAPGVNVPYYTELNRSETDVIGKVWDKYGMFSGDDLSQMTHAPGTPWFKAYFERGRNAALSNEDIERHYTELAMAGRA